MPTKINTRNNQEIVDYYISEFIVKGTPKCTTEGGCSCKYSPQRESQVGCAVGMLLSLEDAIAVDKELGMGSVNTLKTDMPDMYHKYFDEDQIRFLTQMQMAHDNLHRNAGWGATLEALDTVRNIEDINKVCKVFDLNGYTEGESNAK